MILKTKADAEQARVGAQMALFGAISNYGDFVKALNPQPDPSGNTNALLNAAFGKLMDNIAALQSEENWLVHLAGWFQAIEYRPEVAGPVPVDPAGKYMVQDPRVSPAAVVKTVVGPQVRFDHPFEWLAPGDTNPDGFSMQIGQAHAVKVVRQTPFGTSHFWREA